MNYLRFFLLSTTLLLFACHSGKKRETADKPTKQTSIRHARGFTISSYPGYKVLEVHNPWDTTRLLNRYILVDKTKDLPDNLPDGVIVRTPVQKVAVCTAVHAGIWKQLGKADRIVAVCEPQFIDLPEVQKGLAAGKIANLGLATSIDIEKLIAATPDALVVSPFENTSYGRLEKSGIPVVEDASYMEDSPLGRAEWIKFEAAFTNEEALAETIFTKIEKRYTELCELAKKCKSRPTVFTEKKFGQVWYVPGGRSYIGTFLRDAGANYLWRDIPKSGSLPLAFEAVYEKAEKADFWLIKYNNPQQDLTYSLLQSEYELYKNFAAFRNQQVFAVNSAKSPFYEEGPMEPEVILADMVSIFHPELLPGHRAKYYFKMK